MTGVGERHALMSRRRVVFPYSKGHHVFRETH